MYVHMPEQNNPKALRAVTHNHSVLSIKTEEVT